MAKKETIKGKNHGELTAMLVKQREELRNHRFASAGARPKDASVAKKTRKQIARILTEMHVQKTTNPAEMPDPTVAAV
jgi:ribosomal protein L29